MRTIPLFQTGQQLRAAIKAGLEIKPSLSLPDGEYIAEAGTAQVRVLVQQGKITKTLTK